MAISENVRARRDAPALDLETGRVARIFLQRLEGKHRVIEAFLFGSRARGEQGADSDADLAIILEGERCTCYAVAGDMAGLAFDVLMEMDILVQALPRWGAEFKQPELFSNPVLIANIKREGLRL